MASYTHSLTLDSTVLGTATGTVGEKFNHTMKLAGLAADISLTLGALTVPKYIIVVGGASGVSFKLGGAGTDVINAYPYAAICSDTAGFACTAILLSNSGAQEVDVTVYAGE